jgi:hypothetical protein
MLHPHPKYQQRRQRRREDDEKKLKNIHEHNVKMENSSQIWEIKFDDRNFTRREEYDLKQRILINKIWVHFIAYMTNIYPRYWKQVGIIVFRAPHSLHWMHKHILQEGRFKPLDLNTDVDEYMEHLRDKHGGRGVFLRDPPFSTRNPRFVE